MSNLRSMGPQPSTRRGATAAGRRHCAPAHDDQQLALPLFDPHDSHDDVRAAAGDQADDVDTLTTAAHCAPGDDGVRADVPMAVAAHERRSQSDRVLVARIAAAERWARTTDRAEATAPARRGLAAKFEREADPDGVLAPDERARRGDLLMRAHMLRMARRSARARQRTAKPAPNR